MVFLGLVLIGAPAHTANASVLASWVQMAPGGVSEARAVIAGESCPDIRIGGRNAPMRKRAGGDAAFPQLLCAATLLPSAHSASVSGHDLPLPKAAPRRIVVFGDTGCRIEGGTAQACNDPAKWPFARIAAAAAKLKPDLVIHVGDYLYRESPCPGGDIGCKGSPSGDDWPAWAADFFTPASPLLAAAPFVFVRGNHEECARSGAGWLRLLGPLAVNPKTPCTDHVTPWSVTLGGVTLAVMDDAHAPDISAPDDLVTLYRADLAAVARIGPPPVWLVMHRPIWGIVDLPFGMVVGGNRTMIAAQEPNGIPANVTLLLAGHIHTFEAIDYTKGAPPQIIAGEGGDLLNHAPRDLSGRSVGALKIASGISLPGYGFLLFTREPAGWNIHVMTKDGAQEALCAFANRHLDCNVK
ncbi:MAG: metallophosphoesterase family protein [Rhizomicrobium sp.]